MQLSVALALLLGLSIGQGSALSLRHSNSTRSDEINLCHAAPLPPTRCPQRNDRFPIPELLAALPEFAKVYAQRPIDQNTQGMNVNHAFAVWYTARSLRPSAVVESGVHAGQGTWLLRNAVGPSVPIFSLDPLDPTTKMTHWKDDSGKTTYLTGDQFKDFADAPWTTLIPDAASRANTVVVLDDHMSATKRLKEMLGFGFHKVFYEDNWRDMDCYSFNMVCAPGTGPPMYKVGPAGHHISGNEYDHQLSTQEEQDLVHYVTSRLDTYFEFPAILDSCSTGRPTILPSSTTDSELAKLGLPQRWQDNLGYQSLFPPFVELLATATAD